MFTEYGFVKRSELREAYDNKEAIVMRNVFPEDMMPSWDKFFQTVEENVTYVDPLFKNGPNLFYLDKCGLAVNNLVPEEIWKPWVDLSHILHKEFPGARGVTSHLYFSINSESATFGRHNDTAQVFYVQLKGSVSWTIFSPTQGTIVATLEPGDLVYVPKHMDHCIKPWGPRLGISIGLDYGYNK